MRPIRAARLAPSLLALVSLVATAVPAAGQLLVTQAPYEDWRTVELPHFRVHYPAPSEAWALAVAGRLEAIRARLVEEVGFAPESTVDVVVSDPIARPNGSAWPLLGTPRMVLWTSTPGPESVIGHYRDWGELVALHEDAHLVHLLRPSRNPWQRFVWRLVPGLSTGPVARRAPRWVTEGYATVLEGRLTGSGRPNGDLRATVLRARALAGRLPSYGALSSGADTWLGGSMAYLAGSAFLEWLEAHAPAGEEGRTRDLADLWARMSAREDRSFEEAFAGTFGASPAELYGRFTAEVTWQAVEAARRLEEAGAGEVAGKLFQDLSWQTGAPTVTPDGEHLALVLRGHEEPSELVVWETGPDPEAAERRAERIERMLARDPEDVAPVPTGPLGREPVAVLPTIDGQAPSEPRFVPPAAGQTGGDESLLFVRFGPDAAGFLHPDLYRWFWRDGRVERVTHLADVRSPDPAPGGAWAAAVRLRHGLSELVRVDLADGSVTPWTSASVETTWAFPRVAPDGRSLAVVRHAGETWRLLVFPLVAGPDGPQAPVLGEPRELPTPPGATVAYPAWSADGETLYASVGEAGFIDLRAFSADGGVARQVTRSVGAALAPVAAPDALYFLGLEADGLDLSRLALPAPEVADAELPADLLAGLAPIVRPEPPAAPPAFPPEALAPGRPYGLGRQEVGPLVNGVAAPSGNALELGVRSGDLLGRLDLVLAGSLATDGAVEGGIVAGALRSLRPVTLVGRLYRADSTPSEQDDAPLRSGGRNADAADAERWGLSLGLAWDRRLGPAAAVDFGLDGHTGEIRTRGRGDLATHFGTLRSRLTWNPSVGEWALSTGLDLLAQRGATDGDSWQRLGGTVTGGLTHDGRGLVASWSRHRADDVQQEAERFQVGGVPRTVLPPDADAFRILVPALAEATLVGDEHEGQRLELLTGRGGGLLALPLFWERHRVWSGEGGKGDWLELAGIELRTRLPPVPLLKLPGTVLTLGGAHLLDGPFEEQEGDTRFWIALAYRP